MTEEEAKAKATLYIDAKLWKAVRHLAVDRDVAVSTLVAEILREKLQKEGRLAEQEP